MDIKRRILDRNTKHKAIALDRDFIMSLPEDEMCYSLNLREVTTILSILDYQRWVSRWYSDSEISLSEVERFTDKITQKLLSPQTCGEGSVIVSNCPHYVGDVFSNISNVPPAGCLPMNGDTYQESEYPDLVAVMPQSWRNAGLGTFTIPDMDGRTVVQAGFIHTRNDGSTYVVAGGVTDGELRHTLTEAEMPEHDHSRNPSNTNEQVLGSTGSGSGGYAAGSRPVTIVTNTGNAGGSGAHNNMPPFVAAFWYIQATDCAETGASTYALRMNGCLLEYTEDGETWLTVPGWTDLGECFDNPPFDLRFNNCALEYSKDSAQTWGIVPGWDDLPGCLPGLNDRCLNAWGSSIGLKRLSAKFAVGLLYETNISDYSQFVTEKWEEEFGLQPVPNALEAWIVFTWSDEGTVRLQHYESIVAEADVTDLAEYIYTASPTGEWCQSAVETFTEFLSCQNLAFDVESIMLLVAAMFETSDYWIKSQRLRMFAMRGYGTCVECGTLAEKEPCVPMWTKTLANGDVISTDGFVDVFGYDTPSGLLSEYISGDAIAKARLQGVDLPNGIQLSVSVDWSGVTNPAYAITCDVDGVFTTLASGNTAISPIEVPLVEGVITVLQISATAVNTDSESTIITQIVLSAPGECPFMACD